MSTFLDWQIFFKDTGAGQTYLQWLLNAWAWTLLVSICAWIIALILGVSVGIIRTLQNQFIVFLGNAWAEVFRNIPLIIQIFIWYHVIPSLFITLRHVPSFILVVVALGLFTSARISEQVKAGIESLPKGQRQAAMALGFSNFQTYRYILLPLAFRIILPPLTSESMNIIKNSSVAFAVSVSELTMFALQAGEETSRNIEIFLATTCLYFVSTLFVNQLSQFLERRVKIPGTFGGDK